MNGEVVDSLSTGLSSSQGLAYDGQNFYYVRRYTSFCTVIKISKFGIVIDSIRFNSPARYLGGAAWDGTHLWISQYYPNPGKLYRINWNTKTIVDSIQTIGDQPQGVAFDGQYLYYVMDIFSSEPNKNLIYVYDLERRDTLKTIQMPEPPNVDSNPTGLTFDGKYLWLIARPVGGGTTKVLYKYDLGGAGTPAINVPNKFFDFSWVAMGDSLQIQGQIQSVGTDTLIIDSVKINYSNNYYVDITTPMAIPNGVNYFFNIKFKPTFYGIDTAQIVIYHNDITKPEQIIRLTGKGMYPPPYIQVPSIIDYGTRRTHSTNIWKLKIENLGSQQLIISSINTKTFDFYIDPQMFPILINPVSSKIINVWFNPKSSGDKIDTLKIISNAHNSAEAKIVLTGVGDATSLPIATPFWNYSVPDHPVSNTYRTVKAVRAINDITGDGKPDIIISTENYWTMALNGNASVDNDSIWSFNTYISSYSAGTIGTTGDYSYQKALAVASDLNNDGYNDIVIGTGGGNERVYALSGKTGQILWAFGTDHPDSFGLGDFTGVDAARDFNDDGIPDVVAVASASQSGGVAGRRSAYLFNGVNGNIIWQYFLGGFTHAVSSTDDLNNDGCPDVIATVGEPVYMVFALSGLNGGTLWVYPFDPSTGGAKEILLLPVAGQPPDIIVSAFWGPIVRLDGRTGNQKWIQYTGGIPNGCVTQFARLKDVNNDGIDEVVASLLGNGTWCLNGANGEILWSLPTGNTMGIASCPDLDGDGYDEVVIASQYQGVIIVKGNNGSTLGTYMFGETLQTREVSIVPDIDQNNSFEIIAGSNMGNIVLLSGGLNAPLVQITDTVSIDARWNLISVPVARTNNYVLNLFPTAVPGTTFEYDAGYIYCDTLTPGKGYWTKFPDALKQPITGYKMSSISVLVKEGWNLIGSVDTEVPVPYGSGISSLVYGYSGGYHIATSIVPGKGYWIKMTKDTILTIGSYIGYSKNVLLENILDNFNYIIITDKLKRSQKLYFGDGNKYQNINFEGPPISPDQVDIRFSNNQLIQTYSKEENKIFVYKIQLNNLIYPIKIDYNIKDAKLTVELISDNSKYVLVNSGRFNIDELKNDGLYLKLSFKEGIPEHYSLHHNYPNPFNFKTVIGYALPEPGFVTLKVYDVLGREVSTLLNEYKEAGYYEVSWDASSQPSGVYFYKLQAGNFTSVKKMLLMK
ncbi:MAG: Beta-galactosidase [Ignavibacteriae bacterium]|nr:MAG: Beta-galactosidase [Ignavibacteriota bacterium]